MKYTGALKKGIVRKHPGLLAGEDDYKAEAMRITRERFAKLPDLFNAHGIAEHDYLGLVLALANEHVPGFKCIKPPGRTTEWGDWDKAEFRLSVDDMRAAHPGMPTTQAIAKVCRLFSWEAKTKGMKVTALRKHYDAADARWVAIAKDAKAYDLIIQRD